MQRIIITGANGAGKNDLASRLHIARPDVPHMSFDAMKLTTEGRERPRNQIDAMLSETVQADAWILDGGPSLLSLVLPRADAVVWLDPPIALRAWRLSSRALKGPSRTRAGQPLSGAQIPVLACYTRVDVDSAFTLWRQGGA